MKANLKKNHIKYSLRCTQSTHLLKFGIFAIKSKSFTLLLFKQVESFNFILLKKLKEVEKKRKVKMWNCLLLNLNLTKLVAESRMGKGKGSIHSTGIFITPGDILFEFDNLDYQKMFTVFLFFKKKVGFDLLFIKK